MRPLSFLKPVTGTTILLAALVVTYGSNLSRTVSTESEVAVEGSHIARPARISMSSEAGISRPSLGSVQGTAVRADVREPGALHLIEQPELLSLIEVVDSPGRTEPHSRPTAALEEASFNLEGRELRTPQLTAPSLVTSFAGPNFDDNPIVNGEGRIPPDPIGAVGQSHVVEVVNEIIGIRQKDGTLDVQSSLDNFLTNLGFTPLAFTFDPKVTYDPFEDRFVVLALGVSDKILDGTLTDESSIFIAVSDDGDPNGSWCSTEIDSKIDLGGDVFTWADYPGLVVDEEAIYVTASQFQFASEDSPLAFGGVRLWTIDKGTTGGLYDCNAADVNLFNPYAVPLNQQAALQPAAVFGTAPAGLGTFLVGYSGTTLDTGGDGTESELQQVIRVDNPLGAATFTLKYVDLGNIEDLSAGPSLPNAPQSGSAVTIETNDRSTLAAAWRDNSLFTAQTINPTGTVFPGNNGEATAYWVEIGTTNLNNLSISDHGVVDGEDISAGTHTFFPSITVDEQGSVAVGFAASSSTIHPGAYFTYRTASDTAGSNRGAGVLFDGQAAYVRTRAGDGNKNRWGDWSGIAIDPAASGCFWAFNQYAMTQGSPTNTGDGGTQENGRWATRWGQFCTALPFVDGFESGDTSAWSSTVQ